MEVRTALEAFAKAALDLDVAWEQAEIRDADVMNAGYPAGWQDFAEETAAIQVWARAVEHVRVNSPAFTITASDIARCPKGSLLPRHYRNDGTCTCSDSDRIKGSGNQV